MHIHALFGTALLLLIAGCAPRPPAGAEHVAADAAMTDIKPFSEDADSIPIGDLTVENGPDRIAIYGALNITKDKLGLQLARELKTLIDATVTVLQAEKNLPDHVPVVPPERVDNPFNR